jgi:lysophospholipase L1-like esterase
LALGLGAAAPLAAIPIGRSYLPWWANRLAAKQEELAAKPPRLVFYGDSIMQYLEQGPKDRFDYQPVWQHYYGGRDAIDLGFKGDPTSALIWRLDHGEADRIAPRLAIVMIGANDFGRVHWSAANTVTGIEQTVAIIHRKLPETHILLLGVLPSQRSAWVDQSTIEANQALAARYGAGPDAWLTYRDVGDLLERQGRLDVSLFIDPLLSPPDPPLHPSPEGWRRIAAAIEPVLARFMGDAPRGAMAPVDVYGR